ncbi:MAG TPA: hypothetical protein VLX91_13775 [Candidatus Acidoferrales bacterium]|nr:hypothetical protein [Candidatus Acidoferrales bacterium]
MKTLCSLIFWLFLPSICQSQHLQFFDDGIPTTAVVVECLKNIKSHPSELINCNNLVDLYKAEINIGKYTRNYFLNPDSSKGFISLYNSHFNERLHGRDSLVLIECLSHIRKNKNLYREVNDGWKGEENFWEPSQAWYQRLKQISNSCEGIQEIKFDLEFKDFIRPFDIDPDVKGKSCEQYYKELIEKYGDQYRDSGYTDEDMKKWAPECEEMRQEFRNGKKALLEKYHNAPFTKILQDIDETTIVIFISVC